MILINKKHNQKIVGYNFPIQVRSKIKKLHDEDESSIRRKIFHIIIIDQKYFVAFRLPFKYQ
jgi:hypothetical protein